MDENDKEIGNKTDLVLGNDSFIMYRSGEGAIEVDVYYEDETVWLTQKSMAELFGVDVRTVNEHLQNIFSAAELDKDSVIRKFRITASDQKSYLTNFYNLDAIISVGYRVNSVQATGFRIWATSVLRDFIIKGFVLDETKLKNGSHFGKDYFDELVEKVREIRASERRFYQKITDLYAVASTDYDSQSPVTKTFFAEAQNKLIFSITGKTAAEIIASRSDHTQKNMGLTTWKDSPKGKILKRDTTVSKNYLNEKELTQLNRIVNMYLDYAENQAEKHKPMTMNDWVEKLEAFLQFNEYELLKDTGKISKAVADKLAGEQYQKFRIVQDKEFESDFDRHMKKAIESQEDKK